jgi:cytochrome P450
VLGALEPVLSPEQQERGNRAVTDFKAFLKELADARRKQPGDPATDVLTRLIDGNEGDQLSEEELLQNCIFILNAGHETTTNLIGNALYELLQWPDERRRLLADPDLIQTAVDEFLRFQSPNQLGNRRTIEPAEFHGEILAPGTRIHLAIGAANRDPRQFSDPDRLDLSRKPNRHLAFAGGPHLCVGFSLAKMEGRIAVSRFLKRFPDYRVNGEARRTGRVRFRGFSKFPAKVG